jgi:hypothetical protein
MSELDVKKEAVAGLLSELAATEFCGGARHDTPFDIEQAKCNCCCILVLATGAATCS